jgi:uncharacterized protein
MFSLGHLFRKDQRLFALLEGSAEEARVAIEGLTTMLEAPQGDHSRDVFVMDIFLEARSREKQFALDLSQYLGKAPVTALDREDIQALSDALYKIPKTAKKFGQHYMIAGPRTRGVDLSRHIGLLSRAAELVVLMVGGLRHTVNSEELKVHNDALGRIESEADQLMLLLLGELYSGQCDAMQVLVLRDLFEFLEKVYHRCREAGNIIFQIALKQS